MADGGIPVMARVADSQRQSRRAHQFPVGRIVVPCHGRFVLSRHVARAAQVIRQRIAPGGRGGIGACEGGQPGHIARLQRADGPTAVRARVFAALLPARPAEPGGGVAAFIFPTALNNADRSGNFESWRNSVFFNHGFHGRHG